MNKYHVARLDYAVKDSVGAPHQTHQFSSHRTLQAAIRAAEKAQAEYNCIDIVDSSGLPVDWINA